MWVMEIKYFEFYCKFYYFYEHFELKMILWTKYLDNSRPCTKQLKNDTKKQWKRFVADVWKIIFSLTFNSMQSYEPEHLLVYYKFLKNLNLWRTYSTSSISLLQDPLIYCKKIFSIDNSVRRLLNYTAFLVCWCHGWLITQFSLRRPVLIDMRW